MRSAVLILALLAVPPAYYASRLSGWKGDRLVSLAEFAAG
jgi:hypothetical protein